VAEHPIIRLDAGGERRPQVPDAERDEIVPPTHAQGVYHAKMVVAGIAQEGRIGG